MGESDARTLHILRMQQHSIVAKKRQLLVPIARIFDPLGLSETPTDEAHSPRPGDNPLAEAGSDESSSVECRATEDKEVH
ncbi:hypothetical protein OUZ56_016443 [Daphnia magna]|uniref:Uncharacterized protein n=1 Tax=Daphnia magna TaxID=35525 RepID=A0ABR0AQJ6_9CRUS|nr:hypothetical protein OUZ56_016443 [Daphnia magna]